MTTVIKTAIKSLERVQGELIDQGFGSSTAVTHISSMILDLLKLSENMEDAIDSKLVKARAVINA